MAVVDVGECPIDGDNFVAYYGRVVSDVRVDRLFAMVP